MSIFKEFDAGGRDRAAEDKRRHKQLVEESIKKNIGDIIAEEAIIGQNKDKKIKIPIKGIKEYRFVYGKNTPGTGSGNTGTKRGDKVGEDKSRQGGQGQEGAGNQEGEDIYETEITIEELIKYLFDDLKLPDIDRKKFSDSETEKSYRNLGYKRKGIPPRLAKKRSVVEKIKRKQSFKRSHDENGKDIEREEDVQKRFPFMEDDLRYHRLKETQKKDFNAVVICIMDVSGSMNQTKKYMARSFYFLLYQFVKNKYTNVELVFVAHTTTAREVSENDFFHRGESGGTYISSGYEKALEIIEQRYNPANWNIYSFHCSDGDNWIEDNQKAVEKAVDLCDVCNLFGYGEIIPGNFTYRSTIKSEYEKNIKSSNFVAVKMAEKADIVQGLKKLLEKENR